MKCKPENLAEGWASIPSPSTHSSSLCYILCQMLGFWDSEMTKTPSQAQELKLQGERETCGLPALSIYLAANLGSGLVHIPPAPGPRQGPSPRLWNKGMNQ